MVLTSPNCFTIDFGFWDTTILVLARTKFSPEQLTKFNKDLESIKKNKSPPHSSFPA